MRLNIWKFTLFNFHCNDDHKKIKHPLSFFVCIVISLTSWSIFYPGVMSLDSFEMFSDATKGLYSDLHSPFLPIVVSMALKLGLNLGIITLGQVLLGSFGVRNFGIALAHLFGLTYKMIDLFLVFLLVLLFSPITPAAIYFMTLWTDTWLIIFLLWGLSFLVEIYCLNSTNNKRYQISLLGYLFAGSAAILARYNALIIYPFFSVLAYEAFRRRIKLDLKKVLITTIPIMIFIIFFVYQIQVIKIRQTHPIYAAYALDLASMIVSDPSVCTDLYIQSCTLVHHEFSKSFVVGEGAIDFTLVQNNIYLPFLNLCNYPKLSQEFWAAVYDHPFSWVKVKFLNYLDYISPNFSRYFFQEQYPKYDFDLKIFPVHPNTTSRIFEIYNQVLKHPVLRWISYVHLPWLILNILGILTCLIFFRTNEISRFLLLILFVPASYYVSYLIVLTSSEFRFMYPSTLIVQIIALTLLFSYLSQKWARRLYIQNSIKVTDETMVNSNLLGDESISS